MGKQRYTRGEGMFGALRATRVGIFKTLEATQKVNVGGGTDVFRLERYGPSLSPASVAANTTAEQTFTVTGLKTTDVVVSVNKPTAQAGLGIVGWRVSAADTLAIVFSNNTAAAIVPTAAQTYEVLVWGKA